MTILSTVSLDDKSSNQGYYGCDGKQLKARFEIVLVNQVGHYWWECNTAQADSTARDWSSQA